MRKDLSDDGIHPNQGNGYSLLAELINFELDKIIECENIKQ